MENPSPRHHRLAWLALATLGTLLLLPATRYLLRTQMQMEALTYSTQTDLPAERAAASRLPDDYPVQLALATEMPTSFATAGDADPLARSKNCNRRILALAERFPNNPSVYANLLRYMTRGELRIPQETKATTVAFANGAITVYPAADSLVMFERAAQRGAELDPDNAYFPMMQAAGLFDAHRDSEALAALKAAGRCSRWTEYYQDETEGLNRLQRAAYGDQTAIQHLNNAANILFPQYSQLRSAARHAIHSAAEKELAATTADEIAEAIAVRHAVMRCGGLMRAQGASYITVLVGIAIANIGTSDPSGISDSQSLTSSKSTHEETQQRQEQRRNLYYGYLEGNGHPQEAVWAKTEIAAGDTAKSIGTEGLKNSVFDGQNFYQLGFSWLSNIVLLSSALILLTLGVAAHLAGHVRPRKALLLWRLVYGAAIVGGIGLWQWQAARVGMNPYIELQRMFSQMSENAYNTPANALGVQSLTAGLSLLVPVLFVGLIAVLALYQRVSLATGLGRGLRGAALPAAAVLLLVYGGSLLPTALAESRLKTEHRANMAQ